MLNFSKFFRVFFAALALALAIVIIPHPASIANSSETWSYQGGTGPEHWGKLKPEFSTCQQGKKQSPIDIKGASKAALPSIKFDYRYTPFKIINNGHTIELEYEAGSSIKINGKMYELKQFHFHSPSEHTLNGEKFPVEAHLVHKNSAGELAVIGVFMKAGKENEFIQAIWSNLLKDKGENQISGVDINASALPPANQAYYNYPGSLTTPPCSEGVNWYVLKNPIEISPAQIDKFHAIYNGNARPVQPLNGRVIQGT